MPASALSRQSTSNPLIPGIIRSSSTRSKASAAMSASAAALFSAALEDQTCPPSTVFAAFNAWAHDDKAIEVYDFNDHEGGGPYQEAAKLRWLRSYV